MPKSHVVTSITLLIKFSLYFSNALKKAVSLYLPLKTSGLPNKYFNISFRMLNVDNSSDNSCSMFDDYSHFLFYIPTKSPHYYFTFQDINS